jgi:hypothetical protein
MWKLHRPISRPKPPNRHPRCFQKMNTTHLASRTARRSAPNSNVHMTRVDWGICPRLHTRSAEKASLRGFLPRKAEPTNNGLDDRAISTLEDIGTTPKGAGKVSLPPPEAGHQRLEVLKDTHPTSCKCTQEAGPKSYECGTIHDIGCQLLEICARLAPLPRPKTYHDEFQQMQLVF